MVVRPQLIRTGAGQFAFAMWMEKKVDSLFKQAAIFYGDFNARDKPWLILLIHFKRRLQHAPTRGSGQIKMARFEVEIASL